MRKSFYIPAILAVIVLSLWFFVPSAPFCAAFDVSAANCSSWTSGLFGVGLGGVLTLWASWYFGDKSSEDIALHINQAVDLKLQQATEKLVSRMESQLRQAAESLTQDIPSETVDALKMNNAVTLLFAGAPLLAKALPGLANVYAQIKPSADETQAKTQVEQNQGSQAGD